MKLGDKKTISGRGGRLMMERDGTVIANIDKWTYTGIYLGKISKKYLNRVIAKAKKGIVQ